VVQKSPTSYLLDKFVAYFGSFISYYTAKLLTILSQDIERPKTVGSVSQEHPYFS